MTTHVHTRLFSQQHLENHRKEYALYGALAVVTHVCLIVLSSRYEPMDKLSDPVPIVIELTKPQVVEPAKPEPLKPEPVKPKVIPREAKPLAPSVQPRQTVAPENRPLQSAELAQSPTELALPAAKPVPADAVLRPEATEVVIAPRGSAGYLNNPAPVYPGIAQRQGWEGKVLLKVRVLSNGKPEAVDVQQSSGRKALDEAALTAVKQWVFSPAKRGDTPIDGWVTVPIEFKLG